MSIFNNETMQSFAQDISGSITTDNYPDAIKALAEQHRPSRMPFFRNLACLDHAVASDPLFLGELHLIYQSAMHATRAAVYHLPHLDSPALRKRKLQIFIDDDGLPGGDTHHYQLTRAFRRIGAQCILEDEEFGEAEVLCRAGSLFTVIGAVVRDRSNVGGLDACPRRCSGGSFPTAHS
jgi:hypothetical protein